ATVPRPPGARRSNHAAGCRGRPFVRPARACAGNCAAPGIRRGSRSACARATSGPSPPAFALARCGGPVAGTRAIAQAALEQLGQVDDVAGARRDFAGLEWLDPFGVAPFDLLVDELHDGGFEVVLVSPRIPRL